MNSVLQAALGAIPGHFHALLEAYWEDLGTDPGSRDRLVARFRQRPEELEDLLKVWVASDFVATQCGREPGLLLALLESGDLERDYDDWEGHLARSIGELPAPGEAEEKDFDARLKQALRRFRQREMLRIIWRDITGRAGLGGTCADMTAMADSVLAFALQRLHTWCVAEMGEPRDAEGRPQQMVVIAMGKHGAGELNLSSDIDLIFAFPEGGETVPPRDLPVRTKVRTRTNQVFFTRLGQRLIDALDTATQDGFVFRIDMRLRPYGDSGALALSFGALEQYYQSQGRAWERFAMIKARVAAGDKAAGQQLMETLRPFVYRRYLDFAAIDSLRDMKRMIMQQVRRKGMEANIKLGDGGIREVEFIVQVLQLIHGGRNRKLQDPRLLQVLDALAEDDYLARQEVDELKDCYIYLRNLEHRLQAMQDRQTQELPADADKRERLAYAMDCKNWEDLETRLQAVRRTVAGHFQGVIAEPEGPEDEPAREIDELKELWREEMDRDKAEAILDDLGFGEPGLVLETIAAYRASKQFLGLENIGVERLDDLMAVLLEAVSHTDDPDLAFMRVFSFVQQVTRRSAYLVLLLENRVALRQLIDLCLASPWVVECLSKYPVLLDELLKPLSAPPEKQALADELRQHLLRTPEDDPDQQMESLRYFKLVHVLQVAAAELAETMPLMKVSDYLTHIAEVVLEQVVDIAWKILVARHGYPCNSREEAGELDFAVIGYGKLGGIELNYGSDLDLVFLHDGHADLDTRAGAGQRSINSRAFYAKLGQRVINALNTTTMAGRLYEVDLRLRPSGASGLLVSSLNSFEQYQRREAWTWEHQALVRARPVAGSIALGERFQTVRRQILTASREQEQLRRDISKMRQRMRSELGTRRGSGRFDMKQDAGGLVDIEFIVQYLVLNHAHEYPDLVGWSDNMRMLEAVERHQLLGPDKVAALMNTYILYRSRLHRLALQNSGHVLADSEYRKEREVVTDIWRNLFPEQEQTAET